MVKCLQNKNLQSAINRELPLFSFKHLTCIIENMTLSATDFGIGIVYLRSILSAFKTDEELLRELDLAEGFVPVSSIALGHPTKQLKEKERKQTLKINIIK